MSVHSRPSKQYEDGMELRDRKMTKDCTQPLRIGNIRALNGCAGRLFGAATLQDHKNSANKSNRKAMNRNLSDQKANPALKTKAGNKYAPCKFKSSLGTFFVLLESMLYI